MHFTHEILTGKHNRAASNFPVIRGHNLRLQKIRAKYELRNFCFTDSVVNVWNYLPSYIHGNCNLIYKDLITSGRIGTLFVNFMWKFVEPETEVN